ncbi:MAG: zf-TFIIB domain-containing protein [Polyangiaceae bacterium]|nr:zf-TFIIB domain-containing protein [Polyangiaceae bacterium]
MNACRNCGAALEISNEAQACKYCGVENAPPPKAVEVPVPVQLVQQVVQVVGGSSSVRELRCPDCKKRLVTARIEDVELHGCAGCGGIWVDNVSAKVIIVRPQRTFAELAQRAGNNARNPKTRSESSFHSLSHSTAKRPCPACDALLDPTSFGRLRLDVCPEHGTWFDAFELKVLVETLLAPAQAKAGPPADVVCAKCSAKMPAAQANITGHGPMCDGCWRTFQQKQLAEADTQRTAVALAGALGTAMLDAGIAATSRQPTS